MVNEEYELNKTKVENYEKLDKDINKLQKAIDNYEDLHMTLNLFLLILSNNKLKQEVEEFTLSTAKDIVKQLQETQINL